MRKNKNKIKVSLPFCVCPFSPFYVWTAQTNLMEKVMEISVLMEIFIYFNLGEQSSKMIPAFLQRGGVGVVRIRRPLHTRPQPVFPFHVSTPQGQSRSGPFIRPTRAWWTMPHVHFYGNKSREPYCMWIFPGVHPQERSTFRSFIETSVIE